MNVETKIKYKNRQYGILPVKYKEHTFPITLDWNDFLTINRIGKKWKSNKYGFISCYHTYDDETKEIFLHDIIMALKLKDEGSNRMVSE